MTTTKIALAASLGLALAAPALATDALATDAEGSAHARHAGHGPAVSQAVHDAHAAGCKGPCLVEEIHAINHAGDQGATPASAASATAGGTTSKGTTSKGGRDSSADAQARSMDHRRDTARRDAAADRVHDRTADRGQAGAHAMGGGMGRH